MPSITTIIIFASAAFVLNATPGPSMLYALSHSLARGKKAGFSSAFGLATGNMCHVFLNAFGFSYLFVKFPILREIIKYAGAIYLAYLGIMYIYNSRKSMDTNLPQNDEEISASLFPLYKKGIIVEFLNPKTALFYISTLPQFVDSTRGSTCTQMIILGLCVPLTALCVDCTVSFFAGTFRNKVLNGKFRNRVHEVVAGFFLLLMSIFILLI